VHSEKWLSFYLLVIQAKFFRFFLPCFSRCFCSKVFIFRVSDHSLCVYYVMIRDVKGSDGPL
jgi:hypothetical protein